MDLILLVMLIMAVPARRRSVALGLDMRGTRSRRLPGTSRSGVTMTAGLFTGMSREQVARFSFLLAVPVGLLVAGKDGWDLLSDGAPPGLDWTPLLIGVVVSALAAWVAIDWLLKWIQHHDFKAFAIYRVGLGFVLLAMAWF